MMQRFRSSDGVHIAYEVQGSGPDVLLLSGAGVTHARNWIDTGIAPALVDAGYRVIMPDNRGQGPSDMPVEVDDYRSQRYVDDARGLLDQLGVEACHAFGYSLGAYTILSLAPQEPRVRSAILGGCGIFVPHEQDEQSAELMKEFHRQLLATDESEVTWPMVAEQRKNLAAQKIAPRVVVAKSIAHHLPPSKPHDFAAITVACLVINGEEDVDPEPLASALPNARWRKLSGNHLTALADPALVKEALVFLAEQEGSRSPVSNVSVEQGGER